MAIFSCSNLLGCKTLQDWAQVRTELPLLFSGKSVVSAQRRNMLVYCALQQAAPFHVCVVSHKKQYILLHGMPELQTLLDFVLCGASLERSQWTNAFPFPAAGESITFHDIPLSAKERFLSTRIPHCDFSIDTQEELQSLQMYYQDSSSDSICSPML